MAERPSARCIALVLVSLAPCAALGPLGDEVVLLQEGAVAQGRRAGAAGLARHERQTLRLESDGWGDVKPEERVPEDVKQIADGVIAWSREGHGPQRELREALIKLNSMNFVQNVEKVCHLSPVESRQQCGWNAADRLSCPVMMRAAAQLIPLSALEKKLLQLLQLNPMQLTFPNSSGIGLAKSNITHGWAPVAVKACMQQRRSKALGQILERYFAIYDVDVRVRYACRSRQSDPHDDSCLQEERKKLACRNVEQVALSIAGPGEVAKQMAFILGTHPIVIGKGRFDILDDPCQTPGKIALSILTKFLMGVAAILFVYCFLITFCCALYKL